jgi:type VI secretion system secreted protein Hcp
MKRLTLALFALAALTAASAAQAQHVFCKVTGQKQGVIQGDNTVKGLQDFLPVLSISTGVISPRDPASGLPTGKRQHQPLTILKEIDKASPKLFMAAFTNENLTSVDCAFYHNQRNGILQKYFRITLTNASIAETDISGNGQVNDGIRETVQFTYEKITLEDPISGTIAEDDNSAALQ